MRFCDYKNFKALYLFIEIFIENKPRILPIFYHLSSIIVISRVTQWEKTGIFCSVAWHGMAQIRFVLTNCNSKSASSAFSVIIISSTTTAQEEIGQRHAWTCFSVYTYYIYLLYSVAKISWGDFRWGEHFYSLLLTDFESVTGCTEQQ